MGRDLARWAPGGVDLKRRPSRARREDAQSGGGAGECHRARGGRLARAREGPREAPVATPGGRVVGFLNERAGRRHARTRAARHRVSSPLHEHSRARDLEISRRAVLWIEAPGSSASPPTRAPASLGVARARSSAHGACARRRARRGRLPRRGSALPGPARARDRRAAPGIIAAAPRRRRRRRLARRRVPRETTSALSAARPGEAVTAAGDATLPATPLAPRSARESTRGPRPRRRTRRARMMPRRSPPTPPPPIAAPPPASTPRAPRPPAPPPPPPPPPRSPWRRSTASTSARRRAFRAPCGASARACATSSPTPPPARRRPPRRTARASRDSSSRFHAASTPSRGSGASTETTRRSRPCSTSPRERPRRRSDPETATTK